MAPERLTLNIGDIDMQEQRHAAASARAPQLLRHVGSHISIMQPLPAREGGGGMCVCVFGWCEGGIRPTLASLVPAPVTQGWIH